MSKKSEWWFPTAFSCWGPEEAAAIERVLDSGRFTMGDEVATFERQFADWHGRKHGIMVNSGSSANLLMVSALRHLGKIKEGDKAMVPALAWSTTYAPIIQHGLDLILRDCWGSWNAGTPPGDNDHWAKIVNASDPKLIVACSILGNPANLADWWVYAAALGAVLIEDNCESLGALTYAGKRTGTYGLMSSFSFFHSHQISAIEGGMVLTDDDDCARTCRILRAHGWTRDVETAEDFDHEYNFKAFGYNVRPLELHAAIAQEQLKKLPAMIEARQRNATMFYDLVRGMGLPVTAPVFTGTPSPFGLHFTIDSGPSSKETANMRRRRLAAALRAEKIDCRLPTGGSFRKHAYGAPWANQATPQADAIHDRGMFLGNGPLDLSPHIERAVEIMRRVLA